MTIQKLIRKTAETATPNITNMFQGSIQDQLVNLLNMTSGFLSNCAQDVSEKLIEDAKLLEEVGCFALVLEKIPAKLAARVAKEVSIPVIGIGAGGNVEGQVLVLHDMLGMTQGFSPRFLRRYADLNAVMTEAVQHYVSDVKSADFPNSEEQY